VEPSHPCGVFTLVETTKGIVDYMSCSDGKTTRDAVRRPVTPFLMPGAARAWKTEGLSPRKYTLFGESGVEYLDAKGNRHDLNTYVERTDGRLEVYSDGVAVSREDAHKAWAIAVPIDQYKAGQAKR
jgi:hypothetical protein